MIRSRIVWWLLANGRIAADLQRELCFNLDTSWVHASYELMLAARHRPRSSASHAFRPDLCSLRAEPGRVLLWDDKPWTVVNVAPDCITLRDDASGTLVPIPVQDFEQFFAQGHLRATDASAAEDIDRRSEAFVAGASRKAVAAANRAFQLVEQADSTGKVPTKGASARSLRRYRAWMREGELRYGSAYAAAFDPRCVLPGCAVPRLCVARGHPGPAGSLLTPCRAAPSGVSVRRGAPSPAAGRRALFRGMRDARPARLVLAPGGEGRGCWNPSLATRIGDTRDRPDATPRGGRAS